MNHKHIIGKLVELGLSRTDALVYVHLAIQGPQKVERIAATLKLRQQQTLLALENLQTKGIVKSKLERSCLFLALPFDESLMLLLRAHVKETVTIEQNKGELLSKWKLMLKES